MIELIKSGDKNIDDVCLELVLDHPDWLLLDRDQVTSIVESISNSTNKLWNKTFVIPGYLVDKRQHQTKVNKLLAYLVTQGRKRDLEFKFVARSLQDLDLRIRRYIEV